MNDGGVGRPVRVLFVDDETDILDAFAMAVQLMGVEAVCCASPLQALKRFGEDPTAFHAVITDFSLPHLTCAEFVTRLRELHPLIPVHLCTGNTDHEVNEATAGLRIGAVLFKPFDFAALEDFMAAVTGRKR